MSEMKEVFTIIESQNDEKSHWVRIGIGFVNRDDSINVLLDALPINGKLHIRNYSKKKGE